MSEEQNELTEAAVISGEAPPEYQTLTPYSVFEQAISNRTAELFDEAGVPPDFTAKFGPAFAAEIDRMLHKFAKGQVEHGGDIRDRDLRAEQMQELRDAFLYAVADQVKGAIVELRI